jgi:four helix bundle protein
MRWKVCEGWCRALHGDAAAKHVARQLWRAVTSGGANYEEARGAESRADFVHKVRLATKERQERQVRTLIESV